MQLVLFHLEQQHFSRLDEQDEFLLLIDFCFNIAIRLRVFGSSVEYLCTIFGKEACLRD